MSKFKPVISIFLALIILTSTLWSTAMPTRAAFLQATTANQIPVFNLAGQGYTVIYYANGATGGSVPVDSISYSASANVTVLGNTGGLVKTGCIFAGWASASAVYQAGNSFVMGSAKVTLSAVWVPAYTVTYDGNGNTTGTVPTDNNGYASGAFVMALGTRVPWLAIPMARSPGGIRQPMVRVRPYYRATPSAWGQPTSSFMPGIQLFWITTSSTMTATETPKVTLRGTPPLLSPAPETIPAM